MRRVWGPGRAVSCATLADRWSPWNGCRPLRLVGELQGASGDGERARLWAAAQHGDEGEERWSGARVRGCGRCVARAVAGPPNQMITPITPCLHALRCQLPTLASIKGSAPTARAATGTSMLAVPAARAPARTVSTATAGPRSPTGKHSIHRPPIALRPMATRLKGAACSAAHCRRLGGPNCALPVARAPHRAFSSLRHQRRSVRPLKVQAIGFDFGDREPAPQGERARPAWHTAPVPAWPASLPDRCAFCRPAQAPPSRARRSKASARWPPRCWCSSTCSRARWARRSWACSQVPAPPQPPLPRACCAAPGRCPARAAAQLRRRRPAALVPAHMAAAGR
jgi:hypothetical protein